MHKINNKSLTYPQTKLRKLQETVFNKETVADIMYCLRSYRKWLETYSTESFEEMHRLAFPHIPFSLIVNELPDGPLREKMIEEEREYCSQLNWTKKAAREALHRHWQRVMMINGGKTCSFEAFMFLARLQDIYTGKVDFEAFENEYTRYELVSSVRSDDKPPGWRWRELDMSKW